MQDELAFKLYAEKARTLPSATDYQLWLIWQQCKHVASIPFGEAVRDPSLPPLVPVTLDELGIGKKVPKGGK